MTATEEIIKDGLDGGWDGSDEYGGEYEMRDYLHSRAKILLDPTFWKAVGVTRGWTFYCDECKAHVPLWGECECDEDEVTPKPVDEYKAKQHQFLTHLQSGRTIEEALGAIK